MIKTYTPQEMIVKSMAEQFGASCFCMSRDYIVMAINGTGFARHVDDMNAYLGLK